ncbi:MAG: hypothetical protein O7H41_19680 [Planctomycetota bacterium]|nr:hypothetical protein [Planctomycetota bacterium]
MSFVVGGENFCDLEVDQVRGGREAGMYTLDFQVRLTGNGTADPSWLISLDGTLSIRCEPAVYVVLGRTSAEQHELPISGKGGVQKMRLSICFRLNERSLEEIESARAGGSMQMELALSGIIHARTGHYGVTERCSIPMKKGRWADILGEMEYVDHVLLEVSMGGGNPFRKSAKYLEKARMQVHRAEYRDAVATCRDALEAASAVLSKEDGSLSKEMDEMKDRNKWGKGHRLLHFRRAIKVLVAPAKHADDVSAEIPWSREDANAVIAMVASILQIL